MSVPSYGYGLAAGSFALPQTSEGLGKALAIGRDLHLDPLTGDLDMIAGDLYLVKDLEAIRQEAETRMRFFLGEWFLDNTAGLPYFQNILVKAPNLNAIKTILSNEVLKVAGIKSLLKMDLNFDRVARTLVVKWTANTDLNKLVEGTVALAQ